MAGRGGRAGRKVDEGRDDGNEEEEEEGREGMPASSELRGAPSLLMSHGTARTRLSEACAGVTMRCCAFACVFGGCACAMSAFLASTLLFSVPLSFSLSLSRTSSSTPPGHSAQLNAQEHAKLHQRGMVRWERVCVCDVFVG